jgi:DNA-binding CsgD family transcriptional regulator
VGHATWQRGFPLAIAHDATVPRTTVTAFRLITFDSRGTGDSGRGLRQDHKPEDYVLDLEAVADRLGLEQLVLFAPVYASHTAVRYVARHSDRVGALILVNPMPPESPWLGMKHWEDLYTNSWEMFTSSYGQTFYPDDDEDWTGYLRKVVNHADFLIAARALAASDVSGLLTSIDVPVLVMASRDPVWPPLLDAAQTYASCLPNASLVLFDGQGNEMTWTADAGEPPALPVMKAFIDGLFPPQATRAVTNADRASLSERQAEVLRLIAEGKTTQEIAAELVLSDRTVERHIANVYVKIGVHNRAQAAVYSRDHGLT